MFTRWRWVLAFGAVAIGLSGCGSSQTDRGREHEIAIESLAQRADAYGFVDGEVEKNCAIPLGCVANDRYEYFKWVEESGWSDEEACGRFFDFAVSLGAETWRRDMHDEEGTTAIGTDNSAGLIGCAESIGQNIGIGNASQSEGVVINGVFAEDVSPVSYALQLQSMVSEGGQRVYFLGMRTIDE